MFAWLRSLISSAAVIELHSKRLRVRDLSHRKEFDFEPILSVDAGQRVVAIGRPIPASSVMTYSPFSAHDALVREQKFAQLILAFAYSRLGSSSWLKPAPRIVISLVNEPGNGAFKIEDAALVSCSSAAGARKTVVHRGKALTDGDALQLLDRAH
jgi:hypothetical protein